MHNYPLYMNLLSTFLYVPICFIYILPALAFTNWITKEQRDIPKFKFAVMGGLDSISGIMATFAVNYISTASLIVLVQQSAIPISMIISRISLNARYTTSQYIGAAIVLSGIVLVLLPTFLSTSAAPSTSSPASSSSELPWLVVLVISCVPMTLSSVYKEKALGEVDIDIMYLNGWVAVFQTLFAIPLCFPSAAVTGLTSSEILPNLYGGFLCSFGINSITETSEQFPHLDNCSSAPLFVSVYLGFNIVYNVLIVVILKYGSANILWMASTVIVPLSNVAFSLKITPGNKPMNRMDLIGLVIIMSGLVVYRFSTQLLEVYHALLSTVTGRDERTQKSLEEIYQNSKLMKIKSAEEKRQTKLIGLNQLESLNALIDLRLNIIERSTLFRSPAQVRGELLMKLGIPPSPHVTVGGRGGEGGSSGGGSMFSPALMPKLRSQRTPRQGGTRGGTAGGVAMSKSSNTATLTTEMGKGQQRRANEI
jgi:uncharacterized membrane protein